MYQRYYRQRKFGRIFSIFLVIGSGLSHYGKEAKSAFKNLTSFENVFKYQEYFPNNVKDIIEDFRNKKDFSLNERLDSFDLFGDKKKQNENFKSELFVYETNLENLSRNLNEKLNDFDFKFDQDLDKYQGDFLEVRDCDDANYNKDFLFIDKELDKFRKKMSFDLSHEDRKIIESYLTLKSIEKKLL